MQSETRAFQRPKRKFQYRKRYEVYCNNSNSAIPSLGKRFNTASGMRSIAIGGRSVARREHEGFNTASGMRSIAIPDSGSYLHYLRGFQYRKRYEVYCNIVLYHLLNHVSVCFNTASGMRSIAIRYATTVQWTLLSFNTASGMRSIAIYIVSRLVASAERFNTASGMRSIAIRRSPARREHYAVSIPQAV